MPNVRTLRVTNSSLRLAPRIRSSKAFLRVEKLYADYSVDSKISRLRNFVHALPSCTDVTITQTSSGRTSEATPLPENFIALDRKLTRLQLIQSQSLWKPSFVDLLALFPKYDHLEINAVLGGHDIFDSSRFPPYEMITSATLLVFADYRRHLSRLARLTSLTSFKVAQTKSAEFAFDTLVEQNKIPNAKHLTSLALTKRQTVKREPIPNSFFSIKQHLPVLRLVEMSDSFGEQVSQEELRAVLHHQNVRLELLETCY